MPTGVEVVRRNLQIISYNVEAWLTNIDTTTADVAGVLRGKLEVESGCLYGRRPNLKSRFLLSRRPKRIGLDVIDLQTEGKDYVDFSYVAPPAVKN